MNYTKERVYRFNRSFEIPGCKPYFLDFHLLKVEQDYEYPGHKHLNYEVIVVLKEHYYCCLNSTELRVSPGQLLIIQPGDIHQDHLKKRPAALCAAFQVE